MNPRTKIERENNMKTKSAFISAIFIALAAFQLAIPGNAAPPTITMQGWVTNTACDARAMKADKAACMRKCNETGQLQFVDDAKRQVWDITNPKKLSGFTSSRVTLQAVADSEHKKLEVVSVKKLPASAH